MVLVLVRLSDWLFKIALPISKEALFSQPIKFASKRKSCFGSGFTTPFGWLVYLLWFWFYDSQVKTTLMNGWIGKWEVFVCSESALLGSLQALLSDPLK